MIETTLRPGTGHGTFGRGRAVRRLFALFTLTLAGALILAGSPLSSESGFTTLLAAPAHAAERAVTADPKDSDDSTNRKQSEARVARFSSRLDSEMSRLEAAGIYPRGRISHFRLQGYGEVFLGEAVRSPLGRHAIVIRPGAAQFGPSARSGQNDVSIRIDRSLALAHAYQRAASRTSRPADDPTRLAAELSSAREALARHAAATERLREQISARVEERTGAGFVAPLEAARLELELTALSTRLETLEARFETLEATASSDRSTEPSDDPVDRFTGRVVDLLLDEGRAIATAPGDRVSVVLLVSEPGRDRVSSRIQISANASQLPAGDTPTASKARQDARKTILVVRDPG